MDKSNFLRLSERMASYRKEIVQLQTELTEIPALGPENGGDGEAKKAEVIKVLLEKLNVDSFEEVNAPDDRVPAGYRPNLLVKIKGKSKKKTIWIMSHMDIVPPGELSQWETDPYKVVEKDGILYGRGVEDNHQGIISSLLAVKSLREESILPEYDVGLAIVSDEEIGSLYGIDYVLKTKDDIFQPQDLIIIPDAGNPEGTMIEVAEKSICWIKCETLGKQTHGSTPEKGINAHKAAAHFIVKMNQLYNIYDFNDPLFDPPISTFEPTKKEENVPNVNTIPGDDVVYFDCRIMPNYSVEEFQEQIRRWADEIQKEFSVTIDLSYPQIMSAPPPTPPDTPVAIALKKAVKEVLGRDAKTMGIGGGTVAAYFRQAGLPAVCWGTLDDTAHAPNESCRIENVINDARVFAHLFLQD
jgi:succinyl-diaminopimelate desuccinylase